MNSTKRVKSIFQKPFVQNVLVMITGTAAAQLITMLFSPILTRLYGPDTFGILGVFMAIVGIIAPIAALTYPIAIILPKSDDKAKGLAILSFYITIVVVFISILILMLFKKSIVETFELEEVSRYLYFIPLVLLFAGILQVMQQWLIRIQNYKFTAKINSIHALILQGSLAGIGLLYPYAFVLIAFNTIGQGLKALMLLFGVLKDQRWNTTSQTNS